LHAAIGSNLRRIACREFCLCRSGRGTLVLAGGDERIEILQMLLVLRHGDIAPTGVG
jgi:hypothetical protein